MSQVVRVSAKAVIIEHGRVLLVKHRDDQGDWHALPGGGQAHGETLPEAVRRECWEEIGCGVTVGRLLFVRDYMADHHEFAGEDSGAHQIGLMFECELEPGSQPVVGSIPDNMQTGVVWIDLHALADCRLYPRAVAEALIGGLPSGGAIYLGDVN